jgi:hypothetical protein
MLDSVLQRSAQAWSNVLSLSSETTATDVALVAAEGLGALALARLPMRALTNTMARGAAIPDTVIELSGTSGLFANGATSYRAHLLDFARNPFSGEHSMLKSSFVEFRNADAMTAQSVLPKPVLQGNIGLDGVYRIT